MRPGVSMRSEGEEEKGCWEGKLRNREGGEREASIRHMIEEETKLKTL
jgi:hypothetical protein